MLVIVSIAAYGSYNMGKVSSYFTMSQESETQPGVGPIVGIVVVAVVLLALVYANVTGIIQISGAAVVGSNVATAIVAGLFVLTGIVLYFLSD